MVISMKVHLTGWYSGQYEVVRLGVDIEENQLLVLLNWFYTSHLGFDNKCFCLHKDPFPANFSLYNA